ncbi:uncharacterized protein LOC143297512 [Babylonia areolata]|uniref:uncharacterized protein LOC143297512 n=1 Tax=Babylonia areolata TaxID=304850 RepID=UPI003FD4A3F7
MTISPVPCDVMRNEPTVTVTSIKVRSSSSSAPSSEPRTPPSHRQPPVSHDSDVNHTMTSQRSSQTSAASSEVGATPVPCQTDGRGSEGLGGEGGCGVTSRGGLSEAVPADSAKMAGLEEEMCDVSGLNKLWAVPPGTGNASVDDCAKLVYQLSKELAMLDALCLGLGGDTDSTRLREEVWLCRQRSYCLAQQNAACLVPLIRSKSSLKKEEGNQVERLYRIYSGCLEYLVYLLGKLRSLLCLFHLHNDTSCLIQTGLTDPLSFVHKPSYVPKDGAPEQVTEEGTSNHSVQPSHLHDHPKRVGRDIQTIQTLMCLVNNASDVQPWDVVEEGVDIPKLNANSIETSKRTATRTVTFEDLNRRRSRVVCKVAAAFSVCLVIAIIVIASVLTTS